MTKFFFDYPLLTDYIIVASLRDALSSCFSGIALRCACMVLCALRASRPSGRESGDAI